MNKYTDCKTGHIYYNNTKEELRKENSFSKNYVRNFITHEYELDDELYV